MHSFKKFALIPYGEYLKHCQTSKIVTSSQPHIRDISSISDELQRVPKPKEIASTISKEPDTTQHMDTQDAPSTIAETQSKEDPLKLASKVALDNFADECDGRVFEEALSKTQKHSTDTSKQQSKKKETKKVVKTDTHKPDVDTDVESQRFNAETNSQNIQTTPEPQQTLELNDEDTPDVHTAEVIDTPLDKDSKDNSNKQETKNITNGGVTKSSTRKSLRNTVKIKKYPSHLWLTGSDSS